MSEEHWFARRDADILLYRVDQPQGKGSQESEQLPGSTLEHLKHALSGSRTKVTGGERKRYWRVGNLEARTNEQALTGILGWHRSERALDTLWDRWTEGWIDSPHPAEVSAVAPFAFVIGPHERGEAGFLGILRHQSFAEKRVAHVIADLLNHGETAHRQVRAKWGVEPIGDRQDFRNWLDSVDAVTELRFVFKRPNPEGDPALGELLARLYRIGTKQIRVVLTARDREAGFDLEALKADPTTESFPGGATPSFGRLHAEGRRNGRSTIYDQRTSVKRVRIENISPRWADATDEVLAAVQRAAADQGNAG